MTVSQILTTLMDAARDYYQVDRKLSISTLTNLLKPMPNLLEGTDDFSDSQFTVNQKGPTRSDQNFYGLACFRLIGGGHGSGVTSNYGIKPGNYSFSFFLYSDTDSTERDAVDIAEQIHVPFNAKKGWNRYVLPVTITKPCTGVVVCNWASAGRLIAGYKLENGKISTPYLRKDGMLVKAPEILLGG